LHVQVSRPRLAELGREIGRRPRTEELLDQAEVTLDPLDVTVDRRRQRGE